MSRPTTGTASETERVFLACLPLVERLIAIQARRHALGGADAEDFAAWAKGRLIEGDYAIIRKFGGRSTIATYLAVVLANLVRDYKNSVWGRWRPSAAAKRLGPIAVRLEQLLYRDGYTLREAIQLLHTAATTQSEVELARLAARLPPRPATREISLESLGEAGGTLASPDDATTALDADRLEAAACVVREVVAALPPEDGLILRLHFWDGVRVADIARALRLEQMPLYRRIEGLERRLRTALEARGIDRAFVAELLSGGE
ncbi:hypothetical protein [Roseisolibacter agri]|nr:hypothetical protein [Roseisolibacter agri]